MKDNLLQIPGLVAFWDFQNDELNDLSENRILLEPRNGELEWEQEGVFGPRSLRFRATGILPHTYLVAPRKHYPQLGISGPQAQVTLIAWLKRESAEYAGCECVAGVWNEHGQRQYALFLNLKIWESAQQIGAHISSHGGATPGFPYCMDAAIGQTPIELEQWHTAAISYDGKRARAFLDGALDTRAPEGAPGANPFDYTGGLFAGEADFTVGAVARPDRVLRTAKGAFEEQGSSIANPFVGLLGGLAVFSRALSEEEMQLTVPQNFYKRV